MNVKCCRRYRQDLSLLAADALNASERDAVEQHLAVCAGCLAHYEGLRSVTSSLAGLRESVAGIEPATTVEKNWARAIRKTAVAESVEQVEPKTGFVRVWSELILPYRQGWGTIAALWIVMWLVNWGQPGTFKSADVAATKDSAVTINFMEEQRMLAELIPTSEPEPSEPPRPKPSPHSERQRTWVIA